MIKFRRDPAAPSGADAEALLDVAVCVGRGAFREEWNGRVSSSPSSVKWRDSAIGVTPSASASRRTS